jgi:hypothetical protein
LNTSHVIISHFFKKDDWFIIDVITPEADEVFLFFSHNPAKAKYDNMWSGAAQKNEENDIKNWTLKNFPSIPLSLAKCFSHYVTNERIN